MSQQGQLSCRITIIRVWKLAARRRRSLDLTPHLGKTAHVDDEEGERGGGGAGQWDGDRAEDSGYGPWREGQANPP